VSISQPMVLPREEANTLVGFRHACLQREARYPAATPLQAIR